MAIIKIIGEENEYGFFLPEKIFQKKNRNSQLWRYSEKIVANSLYGLGERIPKTEKDLRQSIKDFLAQDEIVKRTGGKLNLDNLKNGAEMKILRMAGATGAYQLNGARFYVDMSHPELSTPECSSARDLVIAAKSGEIIVEQSRKITEQQIGTPILIHKDNSDRSGHSFAAHENYLVSPDTFEEIITPKSAKGKQLILFLLARQIICGAGKVGSERQNLPCDYQLSQRADFIKKIWSLDTVIDRAIINTRDWAYADRNKFRRLHVILGDANMCEHSMFLKYLLTSIFLKMSEDDFISELGTNTVFNTFLSGPVSSLQLISRDYELEKKIILKNNEKISGLEIIEEFLKIAWKYFREKQSPSGEEEQGLKELEFVLNKFQQDPRKLAGYLDWPTKLVILEKLQERNGYDWSSAELFFHDWTYHNISEKGTYNRLLKRGKIKRLVSDKEIERAILEPPNTRAFIRGKCLQKFQAEIQASNWEFLRFVDGSDKFLLNLPDPRIKGIEYQDAIEKSHSIKDLVKNLKAQKRELIWTKI